MLSLRQVKSGSRYPAQKRLPSERTMRRRKRAKEGGYIFAFEAQLLEGELRRPFAKPRAHAVTETTMTDSMRDDPGGS